MLSAESSKRSETYPTQQNSKQMSPPDVPTSSKLAEFKSIRFRGTQGHRVDGRECQATNLKTFRLDVERGVDTVEGDDDDDDQSCLMADDDDDDDNG